MMECMEHLLDKAARAKCVEDVINYTMSHEYISLPFYYTIAGIEDNVDYTFESYGFIFDAYSSIHEPEHISGCAYCRSKDCKYISNKPLERFWCGVCPKMGPDDKKTIWVRI
jgi:hypothetical protein